METIGTLVDKLSILNIKIWHIHDVIASGKSDKVVAKKANELLRTNKERNSIVQELDLKVKECIETGNVGVKYEEKFFES